MASDINRALRDARTQYDQPLDLAGRQTRLLLIFLRHFG
jgi:hypothetical protein